MLGLGYLPFQYVLHRPCNFSNAILARYVQNANSVLLLFFVYVLRFLFFTRHFTAFCFPRAITVAAYPRKLLHIVRVFGYTLVKNVEKSRNNKHNARPSSSAIR